MTSISKSGLRFQDPGLRTPVPGPSFILLALAFAAANMLALTVRAQTPSPQPPPPSDTVFPLGGLTSGITSDSTIIANALPKFGLNMLYNGNPGVLAVSPGAINSLFLPTGTYGIGGNPLFAEADFHLASNESGLSAWDLASTFTNDTASRFWGEVKGKPNNNGEYYIDPALGAFSNPIDPSDPSTYYLWGLDSNVSTGYELLDVDHLVGTNDLTFGSYLPGVRSPKFYIDFAYRLDSGTYTGVTDTAYELEVYVKWKSGDAFSPTSIRYSLNDGTSWTPGTSIPIDSITHDFEIPIRYTDYKSFVGNVKSPNQDVSSHPSESPNLLAFPNITLNPTLRAQAYALLRIEVNVPAGEMLPSNDFNQCPTPCIPCPITVNLKGMDAKGIYVRGARIRSVYADNLFLGLYDAKPVYLLLPNDVVDSAVVLSPPLDTTFAAMRAGLSSRDWKNSLAFNIGNECHWTAWRAFAYLNEQLRAYSYAHGGLVKNFNTIVTGGQDLAFWRPIYEDQSKSNAPPPILQNESIGVGEAYLFYYPDNNPWLGPSDQWAGRPDHDFPSRHSWYSGGPVYGAASPDPPGEYFSGGPITSGLLFAGDDIPAEIKNHSSFFEGGLTITGWNDATASYGATSILSTTTGDSVEPIL